MNPFGQELKKVLVQCKTSGPVSYVGRAAYIQLDPELRARLEFLSLNVANQYNALKLTVLNRTEGTVDVNIIRFGDLLGKKKSEQSQLLGWYLTTPLGRLWEGRLVCLPAYSGGLQAAGGYGGRISTGVPASGGGAEKQPANVLKNRKRIQAGAVPSHGPCAFEQEYASNAGTAPLTQRGEITRCLYWTFSLAG